MRLSGYKYRMHEGGVLGQVVYSSFVARDRLMWGKTTLGWFWEVCEERSADSGVRSWGNT